MPKVGWSLHVSIFHLLSEHRLSLLLLESIEHFTTNWAHVQCLREKRVLVNTPCLMLGFRLINHCFVCNRSSHSVLELIKTNYFKFLIIQKPNVLWTLPGKHFLLQPYFDVYSSHYVFDWQDLVAFSEKHDIQLLTHADPKGRSNGLCITPDNDQKKTLDRRSAQEAIYVCSYWWDWINSWTYSCDLRYMYRVVADPDQEIRGWRL